MFENIELFWIMSLLVVGLMGMLSLLVVYTARGVRHLREISELWKVVAQRKEG